MACTEELLLRLAGELQYDPTSGALRTKEGFKGRNRSFRKLTGEAVSLKVGKTTTVIPLARLAWYLGKGESPRGRVMFRDMNPRNLQLENLYTPETEREVNITLGDVSARLSYDPKSGDFLHQGSRRRAGWVACTLGNRRLVIKLFGRIWQLSHLAFLFQTGAMPPRGFWVDHIDGNPMNNSWGNLRLTTPRGNVVNCRDHALQQGRKYPRGVVCPTWAKPGRYYAVATYCGKQHRRGPFPTPEAAHEAYKALHIALHGEFSVYASRPEAEEAP